MHLSSLHVDGIFLFGCVGDKCYIRGDLTLLTRNVNKIGLDGVIKSKRYSPSDYHDTMDELTNIFNEILRQAGSVDIAEAEFKRQLNEDASLKEMYREWCREVGSSEKRGFLDYCDEYLDSQDDIWQTLNDYDNEE